jgi:hypothetical protein
MTQENDPLAGVSIGQDPLNTPVGDIDTSFPLLAAGLYDMEIADAVVGPAKGNPTHQTLKVTLKTTHDAPDVKGQMVNKGFPIYHHIALTPSEDMPIDKIKKNVAALGQRAGASKLSVRDLLNNPTVMKGKVVRVKVGIQKETEEYPASNQVKTYMDVK